MVLSISTIKFPLADFAILAYNIHRWTCKTSGDYSLNNTNDLQATGTTHNNEKMQWYWIGTKNMWNEKNVWKRYGLSIQNGIDNYIKIT